jgi:hypothetical protein
MSSDAKRDANRSNAAKSTGPTTAAGKAIASQNALRHGLLSRRVLLPGEDHDAYVGFCAEFRSACEAVGAAEESCVEQMISAAWRLRRIAWIEAGLLRGQMYDERVPPAPVEPEPPHPGGPGRPGEFTGVRIERVPSAAALRRYRRDYKAYQRATAARARALRRAEQRRLRAENHLARAFNAVEATDSLSKLMRYQTKLERSLRRAWQMLVELQRIRRRPSERGPSVIDVEPVEKPEGEPCGVTRERTSPATGV